MARRKGFVASLAQVQREIERAQRAQLRASAAAARETARAIREADRAAAADEKERKRLYLEDQLAEVDELNEMLDEQVAQLENILSHTLSVDDHLSFDSLKQSEHLGAFEPGVLGIAEPPPTRPTPPPEPKGIVRLRPGAKDEHERAIAAARDAYDRLLDEHATREFEREQRLAAAKSAHETRAKELAAVARAQHAEIQQFQNDFESGDPEAVTSYFSLVLQASSYPDSFPRSARVAFVPESRQLVVELDLPPLDVVPNEAKYKYTKATDTVGATLRPATQRRALYLSVIAQMALRTVHEMFEADRGERIDSLVFNGFVDAIDPATGKAIRPCVITLRTTREVFLGLDLARVDPVTCLKSLSASVSKSPAELVPVRPVLDFSMVDSRFVEESDVLSSLDQRPNLMELTPSEFESLITNLFEKMGLETRLTQASRDGGVDCVAFDQRPIFGGKVVIQAKRYKHTVGVSAVRDLFGTVQNEGASKGILVTTSGYGAASFQFAEGKPLELLSGAHLLHLLAEHAGIEARIEPPEDWVDPVADMPLP